VPVGVPVNGGFVIVGGGVVVEIVPLAVPVNDPVGGIFGGIVVNVFVPLGTIVITPFEVYV
jgi:hypothetical protein